MAPQRWIQRTLSRTATSWGVWNPNAIKYAGCYVSYIYIYMNILNGVGFYGHYIFYRLLSIHCFSIPVLKCTFCLFMILTMSFYEVCCFVSHECFMYWLLYMLCQKWRNKDIQSITSQYFIQVLDSTIQQTFTEGSQQVFMLNIVVPTLDWDLPMVSAKSNMCGSRDISSSLSVLL